MFLIDAELLQASQLTRDSQTSPRGDPRCPDTPGVATSAAPRGVCTNRRDRREGPAAHRTRGRSLPVMSVASERRVGVIEAPGQVGLTGAVRHPVERR